MKKIKQFLPGICLSLLIAVPAWWLGKLLPIVGGPVFGILIGMLIAPIRKPALLDGGIKFTSKKLLQAAIILLGFEMNLFDVIRVGSQSLWIMLFTLSSAFLTAFFIGRALKVQGKLATLVGVGTSICGGSAIAATAPVIRAEDEQVAQAISTIFLFNVIAVFIFPAIGHLIDLSDTRFGMWAGTAINDTSSVVAAGVSWSESAGSNTALQLATIVKLTRTLMIVPITLVLAIYTSKKAKSEAGGTFHFTKVFPWFVLGFVLTAVLHTFAAMPAGASGFLADAGKFMIVMAMSAIGLHTNLKKLISQGLRPIILGSCCWVCVAVVSLLVQWLGRMV